MFKLWPSRKQYKSWSMPSKLTFISAYLGIFSLLFTLATYFTSDKILELIKNPTKKIWLEGRWNGEGYSVNHKYLLKIIDQSANSFRFEIESYNGHVCEVKGIANFDKNNNAIYEAPNKGFNKDGQSKESQEKNCTINFLKTSESLLKFEVSSDNCRSHCGLNGDFDAHYTKESEYFVSRGMIDEINISNFYKTIGGQYEYFRETMDLIYLIDDLDSLNSRTHSGGIRSLFGVKGGIIMQNNSGYIWIAMLDTNNDNPNITTFKYFTNNHKYFCTLPETINKWITETNEINKWVEDYKYEIIYASSSC